MITHEMGKVQSNWKRILLWDFLTPCTLVFILGWFLDQYFAVKTLQFLVDLPWVGHILYKSLFFPWFVKWHYLVFTVPLFVLQVSVSFRTARVPGPGRAFLRWYQGLLQLRVPKEVYVSPFPPRFDRDSKAILDFISASQLRGIRLLGWYKRFRSDLEQEKREGMEPESLDKYFPILFRDDARYRHIQVVGGSGSGKSASCIAPLLIEDAASPNIATVTLNPKADLYLLKVMATGGRKTKWENGSHRVPNAIISFHRTDSLAYDPLLYGDADTLTKKIMGSSEIDHPYYKTFQESWLMSFFRVMRSEPLLSDRIMLRHLFRFLVQPASLAEKLSPLCKNQDNIRRLEFLSQAKAESLSGLASHIAHLVEDESLTHIFDNPDGRMLNLREVVRNGGNLYIEVDTSSKGPQGRALGRMILMELQLLAGARQAGVEKSEIGIQVILDEFASFAYSGFIELIDKCRSARIGLLLAHQSLGNLRKDNLSASFKDEVVDNTHTKIFLSVKDETAKWASELMGSRKVVKKSLAIGHSTERTDTGARETRTLTFREDLEPYVQPHDFNLGLGHGYGMFEDRDGRLIKGALSLGYVDEKSLCSDDELATFLKEALLDHPFRPRDGSLIDNEIPPGKLERKLTTAPALSPDDFRPNDPNLNPLPTPTGLPTGEGKDGAVPPKGVPGPRKKEMYDHIQDPEKERRNHAKGNQKPINPGGGDPGTGSNPPRLGPEEPDSHAEAAGGDEG